MRNKVDTQQIDQYVQILDKLNVGMLRLVHHPGQDIIIESSPIGIISENAPYRVSTQGAIWNKNILLSLLEKGESAWEFELKGTIRSRTRALRFYCTTQAVLDYKNHVVERGKWFPKDAKRFSAMDIGCDFRKRAVMTPLQYYFWYLDFLISRLHLPLPSTLKKEMRRTVHLIINSD